MRTSKIAKLLNLAEDLAGLCKDGELQDDGEYYDMPGDDAVTTLHSFISRARAITGTPDRKNVSDDDVVEVPTDEESVSYYYRSATNILWHAMWHIRPYDEAAATVLRDLWDELMDNPDDNNKCVYLLLRGRPESDYWQRRHKG